MTFPRINVRNEPHNHEKWGKLVKTWATGMNYVRHPISDAAPFPTTVEDPPEFRRPTSFREFVAQCQAAEVQLFFDDGIDDRDVTGNEAMDLLVIVVPPRHGGRASSGKRKDQGVRGSPVEQIRLLPLAGLLRANLRGAPKARAN
jgi:hypothetical protein